MAERFPTESTTADGGGAERPETPANPRRPWWVIYLPVAMLGFALLAIGSMVVFVVVGLAGPEARDSGGGKPNVPAATSTGQDSAARNSAASREADKAEGTESDADVANVETLRIDEERNIRLAKLKRFTNLRDQVERDLEHLAAAMTSRETFIKDLLDGDAGRRIASDPTYIEYFLPVYEKKHVTQDDYEAFQWRMAQLSETIVAAEEKDSADLPSERLLGDLRAFQSEISAVIETLETSRKDAEAIRRFAANRPAAEVTLRAAIKAFCDQRQEERIQQAAAARRKAKEETAARLDQEEIEQERLRREVKLAQKAKENAELKRTKDDLEEATAEADKQRELAAQEAQLKREFQRDLTQIRSLLRPFITSGMTQPKGRQFVVADEEGPVSLARLRSTGALEPTAEGRELLYWITSANKMNDRDLGGFPDQGLGASAKRRNMAIVKQAQDLLIKYGDLLVDKEMLAE